MRAAAVIALAIIGLVTGAIVEVIVGAPIGVGLWVGFTAGAFGGILLARQTPTRQRPSRLRDRGEERMERFERR